LISCVIVYVFRAFLVAVAFSFLFFQYQLIGWSADQWLVEKRVFCTSHGC